MKFAEKIKELRTQKKMTQDEVAKAIGVGRRTYVSYELDGRYPRYREIYQKLADTLECDVDYLLTDKEEFVVNASEKYGYNGMQQASDLMIKLSAMFAGGSLSEKDKDALFHSLEEVYYECKEDNKKYTPKKYLKKDDSASNNPE